MKFKEIIIKLFKIEVTPVVQNIVQISAKPFYNERATGRTTKLADAYIQLLYQVGEITVKDHHNSLQRDIRLRNIILDRLRMEHQHDSIEFQRNNPRTIKLIRRY